MGYKGDDLELRTPRTWSSPLQDQGQADPLGREALEARGREALEARGRRVSAPSQRVGPIWVDDTVLACCNHAFDVASAHRANEVRIEHLLHALTRIDPASDILDARGIRVPGLRRETATVIASEIPLSDQGASTGPRRSNDLAEALRLAAAHANRRQAPAGVDDLLHVFFDIRPDLPGVELLMRHTPRPPHDISEPLPPLSRRSALSEAPLSMPMSLREPRASYAQSEPLRAPAKDSARMPGNDPQRIETLEVAVRALANSFADERAALSDQLNDLQRELVRQREARPSGEMQELSARLQAIERGLDARLGEIDRGWSILSERLQGLERSVREVRVAAPGEEVDLDPLHARIQQLDRGMETRFVDLGRGWATLADRLQVVEKSMREPRPGAAGTIDVEPLTSRLEGIERAMREGSGEDTRKWSGFADRLKGLEAGLHSRPSLDLAPLMNRLDVIEEALLSRDSEPGGQIADRIAGLEKAVVTHRKDAIEASAGQGAEIKALAGAVTTATSIIERQRADLASAISEPLMTRFQTLSSALDQRTSDAGRGLGQLGERVAGIERALSGTTERVASAQTAWSRDLSEVHDAMHRLNSNQAALATVIEKWRAEQGGDLGIISNRIEGLEHAGARPMALIETMAGKIDGLERATREKARRHHRFWHWLFGTDDWIAASWPAPMPRAPMVQSAPPPPPPTPIKKGMLSGR